MQTKKTYKHATWYSRFSLRKRIIGLVALAGLLYAASLLAMFHQPEQKLVQPCHYTGGNWVDYVATDKSFSLQFPCTPSRVTARISTPGAKGTMVKQEYVAKGADNTNYYFNVLLYTAQTDLSKDPQFEDDFIKGIIAGTVKGKLASMYTTATGTGSAVEYQINDQEDAYYIRGRNVIRGNILYALLATNTTGNFNDADYSKFVNSLKLQ